MTLVPLLLLTARGLAYPIVTASRHHYNEMLHEITVTYKKRLDAKLVDTKASR